MGLLDSIDSPEMAFGLGLLQAGGPSRAPVGMGQGLMMGLRSAQEAKQAQVDRDAKLQAMALQKMQIDAMKKKLATQDLLGKVLAGKQGLTQTVAQSADEKPYNGGYSPDVANAFGLPLSETTAKPSDVLAKPESAVQPSQADMLMAAARQAGDYETYQEAVKLKMEERKLAPKYSTDVRVVSINGKPTPVQMADDGTWKPMGQGITPAEKLVQQDRGGVVGFADPFTGMPVDGTFVQKSQSPDSIASNKVQWARLNFDKSQVGKPVYQDGVWITPPKGMSPGEIRQSGVSKPMNGEQSTAAGFADRMARASRILDNPEFAESQKPEVFPEMMKNLPSFGVGGVIGRSSETPKRQQYRQAQEDWVRSKMRKESGAVIGVSEMDDEIKTFFPQIGDSAEVIAQKAEARRTAEEAMYRSAGPSYKPQATISQLNSIPKKAVSELKLRVKSDKAAKAQFDEVFGNGAADYVLGGE